MGSIFNLRKQMEMYRSEMNVFSSILERRDLTADETKAFEDLKGEVKRLHKRLDDMEDVDADDDATELEVESERSTSGSRSLRSLPYGGEYTFAAHTKKHEYSFARAVRSMAENRGLDGLEGEVSREWQHRDKRVASSPFSMFVPLRSLKDPYETRAGDVVSTTTTMSGGITQDYSDDFYLLLRKASILEKLGVKTVTNVQGNYIVPYETGGVTASWTAEGSTVNASAMAVSQLIGIPRALMARYVVSRQMVYSASYDTQELMFRDMAASTAEQLSIALVNGASGATNPTGILNNTNVTATSLATAGTIVFEDCLQMQTNVADANPPADDTLKYLVSPFGAQILRNKPRITGTTEYPVFVMAGDSIADVAGSVVSPVVPDNLGTGTNETAILYGAWGEILHLIYGNSVELIVDPLTLSQNNQIAMTTVLTTEILVPRPSLLTYGLFSS